MAIDTSVPPYQLSRTVGSFLGPATLSISTNGKDGKGVVGQHHYCLLHKQARGYGLQNPLRSGPSTVGLLHSPQDRSGSNAPAGKEQHFGGCSKQRGVVTARATCGSLGLASSIPPLGETAHRCLCKGREQTMPPVLRQRGFRPQIPGRRPVVELERGVSLYVPSPYPTAQDPPQVSTREASLYTGDPMVAAPVVFPNTIGTVEGPIHPGPESSSAGRACPELSVSPETNGMAPGMTGVQEIDHVLLNVRKDSTRRSYRYKWNKYIDYLSSRSLSLRNSSIQTILAFLLHIRDLRLKHTSSLPCCYFSFPCSSGREVSFLPSLVETVP